MQKPKILIIDDEKLIRWTLRQKLGEWGYQPLEAETAAAGIKIVQDEPPDLVLLDMKLPDAKGTDVLEKLPGMLLDLPVVMITAFGRIEDVVTAMRRGAYDFVTKPFDVAKLQNTITHALEASALKRKLAAYREIESKKSDPGPIVGGTPIMAGLVEMLGIIARSEASIVLLQGESGTGKDLFAQTLHHWSRRKDAPFLAINCASIPANLLESELFGYEKGAFTDAKQQKRGLIELADEGTLFLDEISTLDPALQAKLLRFLETSSFRRLGGLRDVEVDIRVVAATNQDLEQLVRQDRFRKDLFYRLNVCPVLLPPLVERRDDILPLAGHFIAHYNAKFHKAIGGLEPEAEGLFLAYGWPGNVRELKNAIERAMIFETGSRISARHVPIRPGGGPPAEAPAGAPATADLSLPEAEKRMVEQAMAKAGGNKTKAARLLGISRDAMRYKLKKLKKETGG